MPQRARIFTWNSVKAPREVESMGISELTNWIYVLN